MILLRNISFIVFSPLLLSLHLHAMEEETVYMASIEDVPTYYVKIVVSLLMNLKNGARTIYPYEELYFGPKPFFITETVDSKTSIDSKVSVTLSEIADKHYYKPWRIASTSQQNRNLKISFYFFHEEEMNTFFDYATEHVLAQSTYKSKVKIFPTVIKDIYVQIIKALQSNWTESNDISHKTPVRDWFLFVKTREHSFDQAILIQELVKSFGLVDSTRCEYFPFDRSWSKHGIFLWVKRCNFENFQQIFGLHIEEIVPDFEINL